ncbi:MAG: TIGR03016 family PEP-CTERM system-associated outer membrane protein [Betaproteobacteria bacterium]|nr:TIGR03016 family PEP-CTERM system-associated outer membrane protein [Betaproteobacteria bacterium]
MGYSDNPDLVSGSQAKSSWITEITPGIAVKREGGRVKVQADYRMSGVFSASDSGRNDIYHGLDGRASAELVEDWFYLDATARISQQLKEGARAGDRGVGGIGGGVGVSGINNTSQVGAYSLSPYLKHRFGSFATVEARVAMDDVISSDSQTADARTTRYRLGAVSGNLYYPLTWSANYEKSDTHNNGADDTGSDRASVNARYALNRKYGLLAQAGLEKNDFTGVNTTEEDYKYYGLGVFYTPGRRFSADVYVNHSNNGNFLSGSATLSPTPRTSFKASTSQRAFGRTYGLAFSHRTRQSNWTLNYQEDLTNSQQQFLNYVGSIYENNCGGVISYSASPVSLPGCVSRRLDLVNQSQLNETYTSKVLSGAMSYTHRRSTFRLSAYHNKRHYQSSGAEDKTIGLQGSWNLRASPRITYALTGGVSRDETSVGGDESDLWNLGLSLTHRLDAKTSAVLDLRHQQRNSDQPGDSYKENAVTARLNMSF